jgi:hypothetical protein
MGGRDVDMNRQLSFSRIPPGPKEFSSQTD